MNIATTEPFNWNSLTMLLIGLLAAWNTWRLEQRAKTAKEERETLHAVKETVSEVKKGVEEVKVHTNSMQDALVAAEKSASRLQGKEQERIEERQRVDEKAESTSVKPIEVTIVNPTSKVTETKP